MSEGIGARVLRKEDKRFVTGNGKYTDDVTNHGQCYAAFVRSPHAHANVKSIDKSAAEAMDGVEAVLDGHQLTGDGIGNIICGWAVNSKDGSPMNMGAWSALATNKVRYVGDAVAVVIADSPANAKTAAEAVGVDYEVLSSVTDASKSLEAGVEQIHPEAPGNLIYDWEIGDKDPTEAAIAGAAHVTEMTITNNRVSPNPMEPRSAVATFDASEDHYTLYTTSQNPHVARLVLSAFYQVAPEHKLRVIAPDVGGGFGAKIYIYPEEIVCLWASMKTKRSVKWTSDRTEAFLTDAHGRDHVSTARMGFDANNKIVGFSVDTIANLGAYMSLFSSSVPTYLYATLLSGQYNIENIHCNVRTVYTNTTPVDAYRGAGRPEACFLIERIMETAARDGDFEANLEASMKAADYAGFEGRRSEAASRGKLRGIGMSSYIEACGIAPSAAVGSLGAGVGLWESAEVRVNPVGTVEILTGSHSPWPGS
ncbi:Carbon monoxide dehydrogenase large chain [Nymphon striatum]|nr:Carbon monoxide dehydrogenase large chain [Nymphon striatum]